MSARLTRAKRKISAARLPMQGPDAAELPDRLRTVLGVVHLVFTTGHTAPFGEPLMRTDLMNEAIHLARVLRHLMPDEHEVRGLLALMLVTDARRATRTAANGRLPAPGQSRTGRSRSRLPAPKPRTDHVQPPERPRRRYVLQAAAASPHAEAQTYRGPTGLESWPSTTPCCPCGRHRWWALDPGGPRCRWCPDQERRSKRSKDSKLTADWRTSNTCRP